MKKQFAGIQISLFPTMEQVNKASVAQIERMYKQFSCPSTEEEIVVMKTIIQKHMRIRRLKKEGQLP